MSMRKIVTSGCILLGLFASTAIWAAKSCDELKQEIAANIDGNGVRGYALEIQSNADAKRTTQQDSRAKIIGYCGGGTQKIVYWRDGKLKPAAHLKTEETTATQQPPENLNEEDKNPSYSTLQRLRAQ